MSKKIIEVEFFYIIREGLSGEDGISAKPKIDPCYVGFLKPSDIKVISESPEVPQTEEELLKRLSEGCLCIGIKHHDEIAAYMWCNLRECENILIRFDLKEDEAYLMDARTFSSYRGKNLAPYLRVELYRHLRQMGMAKFISITNYMNIPARRFKKKLNAKPQKFYIWINLFMRYKRAIPLKRYKI
jgi:hypothetical protein